MPTVFASATLASFFDAETEANAAIADAEGLAQFLLNAIGQSFPAGISAAQLLIDLALSAAGSTVDDADAGAAALLFRYQLSAPGAVVNDQPGAATLTARFSLAATAGEVIDAHFGAATLTARFGLSLFARVAPEGVGVAQFLLGIVGQATTPQPGSSVLSAVFSLAASATTDPSVASGAAQLAVSATLAASGSVPPRRFGAALLTARISLSARGRIGDTWSGSDYLENELLDHVLRGESYVAPVQVYVEMATESPEDQDTLAGTRTPRSAIAFAVAADGEIRNSSTVIIEDVPPGVYDWFGLYDAALEPASRLLFWGRVSPPRSVTGDGVLILDPGDLRVTLS